MSDSSSYIDASTLARIYDNCSVRTFDRYHIIFYTIHWIFAVAIITLSTLSGLASAPSLASDSASGEPEFFGLDELSTYAGIGAAIVASIDKIVNFHKIADDCRFARSELAWYLSNRQRMPRRVYDQIAQCRLLCFSHPRKCSDR